MTVVPHVKFVQGEGVIGAEGISAKSGEKDREGRRRGLPGKGQAGGTHTCPWTRILEAARILYRMDGDPGKTSCPEIKLGSPLGDLDLNQPMPIGLRNDATIARAAFRAGIQGGYLMPKMIVLYPLPADQKIFERRFRLEHAPMVREKIHGLKQFVASQVLGAPTGPAPYQRVAELYFDSLESFQAGMASGGGQATVAHAMEISTGGPPVVLIAEDDKPL